MLFSYFKYIKMFLFLETLWVLFPDCVLVIGCEILVDWIKHAFIARFNELPVDVYKDYTLSLAYDMAQTRQKNVRYPIFNLFIIYWLLCLL